MDDKLFNFEKSIKHLANIDNKINIIIGNYQPKTETGFVIKKSVFSILNEIRSSILDFYLNYETICKMT